MEDAIVQFASNQQDATISKQVEAEQSLAELAELVDRWSVELGLQTLGLSTLVAVTGERLALIEGYEAQVIDLLEKTDIAAADEKKVDALAEDQLLLTEELSTLNSDLAKQNQLKSDQDIPPLLSRMERAEKALRAAVESLKANKADEAIGHQEQAADILAEAFAIVTIKTNSLDCCKVSDLSTLRGFCDGLYEQYCRRADGYDRRNRGFGIRRCVTPFAGSR
jgi:hypothetical protein